MTFALLPPVTLLFVAVVSLCAPAEADDQFRLRRAGVSELASKPLLNITTDLTVASGFRFDVWTDPPDPYRLGVVTAYNPTGDNLFVIGGAVPSGQRIIEVNIPTLVAAGSVKDITDLNAGAILQDKYELSEGRYTDIDEGSGNFRYTGAMVYGSRLIFAADNFYDNVPYSEFSHGAHSLTLSGSSFEGWKALVNSTTVGHSAGPMAVLPSYAATAFGYPAIAMNPRGSIVPRLGWGPSFTLFDPAQIAGATNGTIASPGVEVLYYPIDHPLDYVIGQDDGDNKLAVDASDLWTRATRMTGLVCPEGYRTCVIFGVHSIEDYCYGAGTTDPLLHNTWVPGQEGVVPYCLDYEFTDQGEHASARRYQIWAYDMLDILAVKNGTKQSWEPQPYAYRELTLPLTPTNTQGWSLGSVTYDAAGKRILVPQMGMYGVNSQSAAMWVVTLP